MNNMFHLKLSGIPKELALIITLLRNDSADHSQLKNPDSELFQVIDWKRFMDLSSHHRVYPVLASRLKSVEFIPRYVMEFITEQYKRNTFQMLYFSRETELISRLFSNGGIPLLFLKGPTLAIDLYGDVSLRTSNDLDMLIPINQLAKADELLTAQGYEKNDYIHTVLNDWKWRHHHVTYFHPQKQIKLEVHWRLNPGPGKEPDFNTLWQRKKRSELTEFPVYTLGKEDLLLFLVSHGARHGWSRLRWLVDIHQLLRQEMDWEEIYTFSKKHRYQRVLGQALVLVSTLFGTEHEGMKFFPYRKRSNRLAQRTVFYLENQVNLHTDPVPEMVARYHKRYLFVLMTTQQKLCFIMSFLYPYPEDKKTLPLPKKFHFLYFPLRPFLWAWRKTRKRTLLQGE